MKLFGYFSKSIFAPMSKKSKKISDFCTTRNLPIPDIMNDYSQPRYDFHALKRILHEKDVLIIASINDLGRNKKERLHELLDLYSKNIRLMIINIPSTLFDFPGNNFDEIDDYYDNVRISNLSLIQNYAKKNHLNYTLPELSINKCQISHNGIAVHLCESNNKSAFFMPPYTVPAVLIKSARLLSQISES